MKACKRWLFTIFMAASSALTMAQEVDSLALSGIDEVLTFDDSLSIFKLIDSLLEMGDISGSSQLAVRLGYNSNVQSAGRTLGIQNFGLAPGVSFYHKSGLYADVSGYWSKEFSPSYYLTITSLGYLHSFSKWFSIMGNYDHYFYNSNSDDAFIPYKNTLSVTPMIDLKPVLFSLNYAFYFGDDYANRIMPGLSVVLQKKKLWGINRVAITPSFFTLFGDETLTTFDYTIPKTLREWRANKDKYGTIFGRVQKDSRVFGVMNYAISAPITVSYKNWGFAFTYTYNIPKALKGEPLTISNSSYLSGSITYFIDLKRKKFSL
ncbi:MAG: hypothetical protein ABI477_20380 [Chryseolinea sp.]